MKKRQSLTGKKFSAENLFWKILVTVQHGKSATQKKETV